MKHNTYIEGKYYRGLGYYLGTRITNYPNPSDNPPVNEHIFNTKIYDKNGAAELNRIKIYEY